MLQNRGPGSNRSDLPDSTVLHRFWRGILVQHLESQGSSRVPPRLLGKEPVPIPKVLRLCPISSGRFFVFFFFFGGENRLERLEKEEDLMWRKYIISLVFRRDFLLGYILSITVIIYIYMSYKELPKCWFRHFSLWRLCLVFLIICLFVFCCLWPCLVVFLFWSLTSRCVVPSLLIILQQQHQQQKKSDPGRIRAPTFRACQACAALTGEQLAKTTPHPGGNWVLAPKGCILAIWPP